VGSLFHGQRHILAVFLLPGLLYVLLWRLIPALYTVYLSFTSYNLAFDAEPAWAGLANYGQLLRDHKLRASLATTLQFSVTATALELALGLGAAILFDRRLPGRNVLLGVVLIPMVLAPVTVATIWYVLFHNFVGPVPRLLQMAGVPDIQWMATKGTAMLSIIVSDVWQWTPLIMLLLLAALQAVPQETVEAAMVDGASGAQTLRFVTLPQIAGMLGVAAGLRFMDAFLELDKIVVMTGGGPGTSTELVSVHILRTAFQFFTLGYAATIVITLLIVLAVLYRFYFTRLPGGFAALGPAQEADA
jgi:multiple sugar transport system permease protein